MPEPNRGVRFNTRPWVSFFATTLFLVAIFFYFGVFPFGSKDILSSEAGGQFLPFLAALKNQLLQGKSLTYSFQAGMGKNFTGVFAYYLSSPLNLPAVLLPMKYLSEAVMFLLILKLSLAGAFMTWLLDTRFSDKTKMSILFGAMYGLCSFSLAFMVHTM
ncbi:MAG: YfhO family protein, partial [Clostridia bacterium]|nr:YfhO family protein [Clostridia bacterium]